MLLDIQEANVADFLSLVASNGVWASIGGEFGAEAENLLC
jgi:hypothetical protein